ncbi:Sugar phosphate permease [Chryseolinea serpens]|uniref:Sugar phosphate permease n=1 Tax=Chryseolinea serpens TaxID=947013 RepID=A0A1M5XT53_9BACT|nr:MFS transporter [Chryseolinea serpens]SHI02991.1 Sugar phosphate permease [Chryseolinea serpens]
MRTKNFVLILLSSLSVLTFLDRNAISIAGHRITEELHLSESQFGWILTAFTLSYGLLEIPMGLWGDRSGEKRIITRIVATWSLLTALTGLATGFVSLFATRFIFGAGEAGAYPNTAIAIRKWFPLQERAKAQAFVWMASRLGGALAPLLIVPLQMQFGWRVTFFVLGGVGLAWVLVWHRLYPSESPLQDNTDQQQYVAPENDAPRWTVHLKDRNFWFLLVMYYCYACGVFFFISWLPKYLQAGRMIAEKDLSYSAALPFLLAAGGCLLGGWLSDHLVSRIGLNWGRKLVPVVGLSLSALLMLGCVAVDSNVAAVIMLALGLATMDVTAPVSWAIAIELAGKASGAVTGAMNTAGLLGGTIASLGVGYLISWTGSYDVPLIILAIQLLIGAFFASQLKVSTPRALDKT